VVYYSDALGGDLLNWSPIMIMKVIVTEGMSALELPSDDSVGKSSMTDTRSYATIKFQSQSDDPESKSSNSSSSSKDDSKFK
jgi:hypothetical protein